MLDRAHALLHRELDVLDADVVLEVDERLDAPVAEHVQRRAERAAGSQGRAVDRERARPGGTKPARSRRRSRPAASPSASAAARPKVAVAGAGRALALGRVARPEDLQRVVEGELAARLREEMDGRRPAARHQERVAGDRAHAARGWPSSRTDLKRAASLDRVNGGPDVATGRAGGARRVRQRPGRLVAEIGDQRDRDARRP